jgi:hypothetical protein
MQDEPRLAGVAVVGYIQSIIGATEKRRESGASMALVTDIGDLESVRLGGGEFNRIGLITEIHVWVDATVPCVLPGC